MLTLRPSTHVDPFTRDHLPPMSEWPVFDFDLPSLQWPDSFNCAEWLLDNASGAVDPNKPAIYFRNETWTYQDLTTHTNQICQVLTQDLGIVAGNRVLLRGSNSPMLFASWLAVVKVGAVVISTMPLLRTRELREIIEKSEVRIALCEDELLGELEPLRTAGLLDRIITYGAENAELAHLAKSKNAEYAAFGTSQDDVCLLAFTSGTTGKPKATMHFHRDVAAICATFAAHTLSASPTAIFAGTPPIAFTFGLGAVLVFPLFFRAAIAIPDASTPASLGETIQRRRVTHTFTSPTGYKALAARFEEFDLSSLQVCVAAGEALAESVANLWFEKSGIRIVDGIGGTEMLHIFISAAGEAIRTGATGRPIPGYTAELFDELLQPIPGPGTGRLGVRGPTGCRYLADSRQRDFVRNGWNMTGDVYRRDEQGYFWYVARVDDMIVSSGYNIAGPEIETALAEHPAVKECAVVGWPDPDRGQIVKAFVVADSAAIAGPALAKELQEHIKRTLAPYKYPRAVEFLDVLPKTATGKLQRSALRARSMAAETTAGQMGVLS